MRDQTARTISTFLYESLDFYSDPENAFEEIAEIVENEVSPESVREIINFWQELSPLEKEKMYITGEIVSVIKNIGKAPIQEAA